MKLLLLDTYGLVYRAFFALPELTTSGGVPINAAYGFTQMLAKILADEQPTHVVAAFDRGLPQRRTEQFEAYKAHRPEMPDALRSQFGLVRRILEAYGIPIVELDDEEADDVIATLAARAESEGNPVEVVTGDLDLLQIVDERTTVLVTRRGITSLDRYTPQAVRERFELDPVQLTDYRGLKGDPSDNLPGVPGIGEKTAIKLIKSAGSLDALLADPEKAGTARLANLLREHADSARVCRDVSRVSRDLAIDLSWEDARFAAPPPERLIPLYRELEFKTLLARLTASVPASASADGAGMQTMLLGDESPRVSGTYVSLSDDEGESERIVAMLHEAVPAERVGIALCDGRLGVSAAAGTGFSLPLRVLEREMVREGMRALAARSAPLLAHDAKSLVAALRPYGVQRLAPFDDDVMILAYLLDPARSYVKLGDIAVEHLGEQLPDRGSSDEACAAADAVLRLAPVLRERLSERGQSALYETLELPLVSVLASMEAAGIAVDRSELHALSREVDAAVIRLHHEIQELADEPFNVASPQQIGTVLFERLKLPGGTRNKTGWATGVEVLQPLARDYPICAKILEYREVNKLKNTYIDVLPGLVGADGRLRTVFHQTSTATGRISSTNPNLQNIPVRGELGRRIRRAFVASDSSRVLLSADYDQIELRIVAHLSGDEAMLAAFTRGEDIHDVTARGIFHLDAEQAVVPEQRRMAKSVNFGLLYGMSEFGLAQRLGIARNEARTMIEAYFARFPSVRAYIERILAFGREHGYVETVLGRRRYFPDLQSRHHALRAAAEREATNAPMQGSAADVVKLAMVRLDRALRDECVEAVPLLQIHDELILETEHANLERVARLVKREMEGALTLSVPLAVTVKAGVNWQEVQEFDVEG